MEALAQILPPPRAKSLVLRLMRWNVWRGDKGEGGGGGGGGDLMALAAQLTDQ